MQIPPATPLSREFWLGPCGLCLLEAGKGVAGTSGLFPISTRAVVLGLRLGLVAGVFIWSVSI